MLNLNSDSGPYLPLLFLAGAIAYTISLLAGGGGSLLVLGMLNLLIKSKAIPSLINFSETVVRPYRLYLFWENINWQIVAYYVPFALIGTLLGAWSLALVDPTWLKYLVALFLLSAPLQYGIINPQERSFPMRLEWFGPLGFISSYLSALIGATGPIENPFYFNYGVDRNALIATKTATSFLTGLVRLFSYWNFGLIYPENWPLALALTGGELVGTYIGKHILENISETLFRRLSIGLMTLVGLVILAK